MSASMHPVLPTAPVVPIGKGYRPRPSEQQHDFYAHADCYDGGIGRFELTTEGKVLCACCGEVLHSLKVVLVED